MIAYECLKASGGEDLNMVPHRSCQTCPYKQVLLAHPLILSSFHALMQQELPVSESGCVVQAVSAAGCVFQHFISRSGVSCSILNTWCWCNPTAHAVRSLHSDAVAICLEYIVLCVPRRQSFFNFLKRCAQTWQWLRQAATRAICTACTQRSASPPQGNRRIH